MSLQLGTRLGPYEILGLIGAGGMGEVYRARDTRLHRIVAVKTLRAFDLAAPDRLERFSREAQAAASLNHANLLAVYDVGVDGHGSFIVSELLEGETLRDALTPGVGWPIRKALAVATQIGRGLEAAHAHGIIHRDLKPENIFIGDNGVVKILDFGLARLADTAPAMTDATASLTGEGHLLGTVGYMSPETLRGGTVDHRADIFAFGAVLYEILTGRRAFAGDSAADTMTAILTTDPPNVTEITASIPEPLAHGVMRCLAKQPEARFQSTSDLVFAMETLPLSPAAAPLSGSSQSSRTPWSRYSLPALIGLLLLSAAVGLGVRWGRGVAEPRSASAVVSSLPRVERLTEFVGLEEFPAVSPDGKSVAFTANVGGKRQLFVRLVAGGSPLQLTNAAVDHQLPRWSPDSSELVYFAPAAPGDAQGTIWAVSALGGAPRRITNSLGGADVSRDGAIVSFRLAEDAIELVTSPRDGSRFQTIAQFPARSYYWYPRWSPDAKWIAFQRGDGSRFDVFAVPAGGGDSHQLTHDNTLVSGFSWLPDSSGILYSSGRRSTVPYLPVLHLWETHFGNEEPRQITFDEISYMHPDVANDGTTVVSRMRREFDVWKFPVDGAPAENARRGVRVTHQTGNVQTPTTSPNGQDIAFLSDSGGHANLWVIGMDGSGLRQITHERDPDVAVGIPQWSPDAQTIAFVSSRGNPGYAFGIWLVNPDGGNLRSLLPLALGVAWAPDGRRLYYVERANDVLKKISVDGGQPIVVRTEKARNVIGLDGSTLYYLVERALVDGRPEFDIRAASPEDGPSRLLASVPASRLGGWQIQIVNPALSPNGQWLAQALIDGFTTNIWALSTATGEWRQITDFGDRVTFIARRVTWSSDGKSILASVGEGDADIVLLNGLLAPTSQLR